MKVKNEKQKVRTNTGNTQWLLPAILLITFFAFSNSLKNEFITNWDDNTYIINNHNIKDLSFTGLKEIFTSYDIGNYHPLTMLSFAFEFKLFGLNPRGFHFFNLLFHLVNVWLVYRLIMLLSKRTEVAAIVAALFAVHPMHVESISWISERKDVLYSMFFLGSLITYIHYINSGERKHYTWSVILFLLSLLSKSMAVTLPLLLILFDYFLERKFDKRTVLDKIPFFLLSVIFGIVALNTQTEAISLAPTYSLFDRLFIAGNALLTYCIKLLVPVNLSAMYEYPARVEGLLPWIYYASPFIILSIFALLIFNSRNKKAMIFGTLFFLITISLVIQVIPFGRALIADRYTYIPYIGLFYMIGVFYCGVADGEHRFSSIIKPQLKNITIALILLFALLTWNRNKVWHDGLVLFEDVIQKNPNVGYAYFARAEAKDDIKDYAGAITDFSEALRFNPTFMDAYLNRGVMKHYIKDNKGAIDDFTRAIALQPNNPAVYMNRGICKLDLNLREEACADFEKARSMNFESANGMTEKYCK